MKELCLTVRLNYPEGITEVRRKLFAANLTVTWRALIEDSLHQELGVPLSETHQFVGDYSVTESDLGKEQT